MRRKNERGMAILTSGSRLKSTTYSCLHAKVIFLSYFAAVEFVHMDAFLDSPFSGE
jgi:hypothetical protein